MKKEIQETLGNVWYDTAASPYLYRSDIWGVAARTAGLDRILFGSDFPLLSPSRYFKDMIEGGMTEAERRRVCGENAARLLAVET
jgi:predicted TIM-barrel fold metal-dependent hydrolase